MRQIYKSLVPYETRLWFYKLRHLQEYDQLRSKVHPSRKGDFSLKPFDEYRCIFVHITKTAGTSVAKSLFGYLPYHYTAIDYRVIFGKPAFDSYFKFAYVRNPWDRLYSAYRYLKSGGWNDDDRSWAEENLGKFDTFDTFIRQWLSEENIRKHRHFWPQYRFICDRKGRILLDYMAYFETLGNDFSYISSKLNIDAHIGHHNANPGIDYRDAYNHETRKIVETVYATDIQLFGYDFDGIRQRTVINKKT